MRLIPVVLALIVSGCSMYDEYAPASWEIQFYTTSYVWVPEPAFAKRATPLVVPPGVDQRP